MKELEELKRMIRGGHCGSQVPKNLELLENKESATLKKLGRLELPRQVKSRARRPQEQHNQKKKKYTPT